ncbi:RNA polymerase sigma factor [Microbacterium xanthum]|uniref:RNA polymerase sigma factor n=1 Tax=Microbacterium xanthum TaxID=3079794 RepID=UPI002AD4C6F5|nr:MULTISPECIES: RNA polymerase sigma factor [unclassified Microbacterium]MDZ8172475.1 RNA polymerase sigma factor [Microbacterium sp. KSW-48]MDZ8202691.1 RNA polymerase sigma factor [Microbacterium sp. SSW1-59]
MGVDDGELIARSLRERAVFAEIYDRHERVVFRYAARRVGVVRAEDIVSETFLVAYDRREIFDGSADARPWLLGIATRLIGKLSREEARAWRGMVAADLARVDEDPFHAADDRLDAGRVAGRLGRMLARLPAGDRDALLLYAFADLDYAGVASALGVPVGTIRSRLNRARRKLRAALPAGDVEENHGRDFVPTPSTE